MRPDSFSRPKVGFMSRPHPQPNAHCTTIRAASPKLSKENQSCLYIVIKMELMRMRPQCYLINFIFLFPRNPCLDEVVAEYVTFG